MTFCLKTPLDYSGVLCYNLRKGGVNDEARTISKSIQFV